MTRRAGTITGAKQDGGNVGVRGQAARVLVAVATVMASLWIGGRAGAQEATFTISPASGPPGTTITAESVTPCFPSRFATLTVVLTDSTGTELDRESKAPIELYGAGGIWTVELLVPAETPVGEVQVLARCTAPVFGAPDEELEYQPQTFTVTTDEDDAPKPQSTGSYGVSGAG